MVYKDILADLHVHTNFSKHAFSTLYENVQAAQANSLQYIAITDHYHVGAQLGLEDKEEISRLKALNQAVVRHYDESSKKVGIISGVELNFGKRNVIDDVVYKLGIRLGGFHTWYFFPEDYNESGYKEYTAYEAIRLAASQCPMDIFVHPERDLNKIFSGDRRKFAYLDWCVDFAANNDKILEVNEASLKVYGLESDVLYWLSKALKRNVRISIGTDSHWMENVGHIENALRVLNSLDYPKELIVNTDEDWLYSHSFSTN